ncbi:unnamed protein product [Hymenolepis diminuta]|uniref:Integrase catalytic domain-containing protein n=1 Tax=Hymenolepis diminuta TaxID=6216 RepID=A0A564YLL5_HYMDI|nr:unnamed protein product [Hymenolepis diminuta]VUZ55322.1 unnamed protein product [Hymenolepis diminuta]VUZ55326.1 unnamed protein product [Hymenolepis diminuta]
MHDEFADSINGIVYLVLVYSHSQWLEVISMLSMNTVAIISVLDWIFTMHGFRGTLVSMEDNGIRFCSWQFEEYCRKSIYRICTSSYHPQLSHRTELIIERFERDLLRAKE